MTSYTEEIRRNAREIRQRLRRPPNAVPDTGINVTRISSGVKGDQIPEKTERVEVANGEEVIQEEILIPIIIPGIAPTVEFPLTFNRILTVVADHYGLSVQSLKTASREHHVCRARWMAIHLGVKMLRNRSIASMARELRKDHTSLIYARDQMEIRINNDNYLAETVNNLHEVVLGANSP